HAPFKPAATNFWLETSIDMRRLHETFAGAWHVPPDLPMVSLQIIGDEKDVRTRAQVNFPKPFRLELQPWNMPTNLVHDPLASFTAMKGIRPCLASLPAWTNLYAGPPPDQVYLWTLQGPAVESYFAAPLLDVSNSVYSLSGKLMD